MKPAAFDYFAPETLGEALGLLERCGPDAKPIAGGQSLVPLMNMRVVRPAALIDLNRIREMFAVRLTDRGELCLGAMVRHRTLERDPMIRARAPLLSEAAARIGHVQIRTRGTLGGSLAHADPAAELPPTVLVLNGIMVLQSASGGVRTVPAQEFFVGPLATALLPGELLMEVRIPPLPSNAGVAFVELARRHGDFAVVGAAALASLDGDGRFQSARLALCGVGGVPYCPPWLNDMVRGERPGEALYAEIGRRVTAGVDPDGDIHGSAEYRRKMAAVMCARALEAAARKGEIGDGLAAPH